MEIVHHQAVLELSTNPICFCYLGYTILDCVYSDVKRTFYAIDLIVWNQMTIGDSDVECRLHILTSNLGDNANFLEQSIINPVNYNNIDYNNMISVCNRCNSLLWMFAN